MENLIAYEQYHHNIQYSSQKKFDFSMHFSKTCFKSFTVESVKEKSQWLNFALKMWLNYLKVTFLLSYFYSL